MRTDGLIARMSAMGIGAQASVPGLYAWGVTVAPAALARGASVATKGAAVVALCALLSGPLIEGRLGGRARISALWMFVLASAVVWSTAPSSLAPSHVDGPRGLAGMLGWALFALAWSAPALPRQSDPGRIIEDKPLAPVAEGGRGLARGDTLYIVGGGLLAVILQTLGWAIPELERALLVRVVALAAGLAIVGAATEAALARHAARNASRASRRLRRGLPALLVLGVLAFAGLLFGSGG